MAAAQDVEISLGTGRLLGLFFAFVVVCGTPPPAAASAPASESPHASAYVVQVAAVSKKEDAEALAGVLRKKNYPVFLASNALGDPLFHVQVGPFNDIKDAETMLGKLAGDGYSPIVKKLIELPASGEKARPEAALPTVLVWRNGQREEVKQYAVIGSFLYDYTKPRAARRISLDDLDLDATERANQQRGVQFLIPPGPSEVTVRF